MDLTYEAGRTLRRLRPQIKERIAGFARNEVEAVQFAEILEARLAQHWPRLFGLLYQIYGQHYDFFYYLERILMTAVRSWLERPEELRLLDLRRENDPDWYLSERMVGGSLYVDLFSGDMNTLREKIPYLKDLGLTYIHLMPFFKDREGNNDGGYAISNYRTVDPDLGTMDTLKDLARECRAVGISLVVDFVFNHTADDHEWAIRAQEGDRDYMNFYHVYPDRTIPDQYERSLREIFPEIRRGNFTWHEGMQSWVWTTFNSFQWDLKYANPEVFRAMVGEMLFLANTGVDILRLDAVAFIWKQMGTTCENLPEAHLIIQAFNSICRIAAPGLAFKSEAIVHPDQVIRYISTYECQLSYNPTLMALLWEAVATRDTKLLKQSVGHRQHLLPGTVWLNYLRSHDDIGWSFDNEDAWAVGINPEHHRQFLNNFYTGRFQGSFAVGVPFQQNLDTGDMRVSGTMASLAGLEQAKAANDSLLLDMALKRIQMLYSVLCSIGGIPLIFLGEEWGVLNDYSYLADRDKKGDSRWVHRPRMDWSRLDELKKMESAGARVFRGMQELFKKRKECRAFNGSQMRLLETGNTHVICYLRWSESAFLIVLANFADAPQTVSVRQLRTEGFAHFLKDVLTDRLISTQDTIKLEPYETLWLRED